MKNKISFLVFALFLALSLGGFARVSACSCAANISPCERFGFADEVFTGKAIGVRTEKRKDEKGVETGQMAEFTIFEVEEVISGAKTKKIEVRSAEGSSCDTSFTRGEKYLIFADGDAKQGYSTNYCAGNKVLSDAQETLDALRNLPAAGAGGRLYGNVSESLKKRNTDSVPMAGVNIKIRESGGKRKTYNTVTDSEGNYEIIVPEGKYKIVPAIPSYATLGLFSDDPVSVKDRSCSQKSFSVENNSEVTGKVVDAEGNPVAGVWVELVSIDNEKPVFLGDSSGQSEENGEFTISNIPSGRYTLSVNFTGEPDEDAPFPTAFYPNAAERARATIFEIGLGQSIDNLIFRLPPRLAAQKIYGTVIFPDGRPAAEMTVNLQRGDSDAAFSYTRTDKNGNFVLNGFTGEKYNFGVQYYGDDNEKRDYDVKKSVFTLDKNTPLFRLVLEKKPKEKENQ